MIKTGQNILIVCDSPKSLIDFRGKLIEELVKKHKVYVFTPRITQPGIRKKLNSLNVTIHENDLNGSNVSVLSDIRFIIKLYRTIKLVQPSVFFPYTFKPVIYGTILAKFCRVKVITPMLTGLGYNFTQTGNKNLLRKITRLLLRISLIKSKRQRIIFQNKDDCQTLLQHKVISSKHKTFIVNGSGVDLEHYHYSQPDIENVSFIMVSRLINAKGINEYYEAARIIKMRYPDVAFKLIGSYDNNVDSIGADLYDNIKNGTAINYLGEVDDVRPYIRDASIIVLPSYYGEGIPRCLLEGMAMGRAIITTNCVGCKETVNEFSDKNGFLIPAKNSPELISKIDYYLNNRVTIHAHGLNGLALAKQKFNVHMVNAELLKIMQLN